MIAFIDIQADDDPVFIGFLNRLLHGNAERAKPDELVLVRIDNWFDHKWCAFAGQHYTAAETGLPVDFFERHAQWRSATEVTVPPFAPGRIVWQRRLNRAGSYYAETGERPPLHKQHRRRSSENLQNYVIDHVENAVLAWFSGSTQKTGQGSLLWYRVKEGKVGCLYVSFRRNGDWKVNQTRNMSREVWETLLEKYISEERV